MADITRVVLSRGSSAKGLPLVTYADITNIKTVQQAILKTADMTAVASVIKTHSEALCNYAKGKAPVDTGFLRSSISVSYTDNGLTGIITANAPYSGFQEYGTRYHAAHPFMRPALEHERDAFINDIKRYHVNGSYSITRTVYA